MPTQIFVNLPVKDLNRSIKFFTELGYSFNAQFTDESATCLVISPDIYAMLLVEPFFKTFTSKPIVDATKATEAIIALSVDSRAEVDQLIERAFAAGGTSDQQPQDHGYMYERGFQDLDGHQWEILWMDPDHIEE